MVVLTEDLGKIFEMAICLLYETEYNGNYKYNMDDAMIIKKLIYNLKYIFPYKLKHTAKNGNKYDFTSLGYDCKTLSAKTTKKNGKVCPQITGQPSRKKFCSFFDIDSSFDLDQIKLYIEDNIHILLTVYVSNTFECPVVYYNKYKNLLLFIQLKYKINWTNNNITFSHNLKYKKWNESSSIKVDNITIGEFQVHNHRDCIKFRWSFENLLNMFEDNFNVINL